MKRISLRLPDELHDTLKALAEREHRSLHGLVVHILREHDIPPAPDGAPSPGGPVAA